MDDKAVFAELFLHIHIW